MVAHVVLCCIVAHYLLIDLLSCTVLRVQGPLARAGVLNHGLFILRAVVMVPKMYSAILHVLALLLTTIERCLY